MSTTSDLPAGAPRPTGAWRRGVAALVAAWMACLLGGVAAASPRASGGVRLPAVASLGAPAPDGALVMVGRGGGAEPHAVRLSDLAGGHPTLVWFIATWCPVCQTSTEALAQAWPQLRQAGVRVVELELYRNLGAFGPSLSAFRRAAGKPGTSSGWMWGVASRELSLAFDPHGYPDVYYLLDARGVVRLIGMTPATTLSRLLQAVRVVATGRRSMASPLQAPPSQASGSDCCG